MIFDLALAVLLFYSINWIGKHSSAYGYLQLRLFVRSDQAPAFNFILRAFSPVVFIILVAAICYYLHLDRLVRNIWLVAVYYFGLRLLYNLALGRARLLNWPSVSAQLVVGIAAAYLAYKHLILPRRPLLPDLQSTGNELWLIIALFLYAAFNTVHTGAEASARRKNNYIRSRFQLLSSAYGGLIAGQFPARYMELVGYSILIVETFNRPWIVQRLERAVFPWVSHTLGPMQVRSDTPISDRESVHRGMRLLRMYLEAALKEVSGTKTTQNQVVYSAVAKYNRDSAYIAEVLTVLSILRNQVAPEYRTEFDQFYVLQPFK